MPPLEETPFFKRTYVKFLFPLVLLPSLIAAIFFQTLGFDFCIVDDNVYVTGNSHVINGITADNLKWAFTSLHANFYHPLTTLSHMMDVQLFGLNPSGHHLTNILIHTLNSLLLFACLKRLTGEYGTSLLISLLFSVHPLHVESVAWISQRKDLLSGTFFFLSLLTYTYYALRPTGKKYFLVYTLFLFGLLAKPVIVTMPFLLLLLDLLIFKRVKFQTDPQAKPAGKSETLAAITMEKIPFFITIAIFSYLAFAAQKSGGAIGDTYSYPLSIRVKNAIISCVQYIKKTVYPDDLAIFYPHPGNTISTTELTLSLLVLAIITLWTLYNIGKTGAPAAGWFWFTGMLVPVSGIIQVGSHGMADRYTYLSIIGLFMILPELARNPAGIRLGGKLKLSLSAIMVISLSVSAWRQTSLWRDSETLLKHALAVTENNVLASQGLGTIYLRRGEFDRAEKYFKEALRINPDYLKALNGIGTVYFEKGEPGQAVLPLEKALNINPDYEEAHNNLANALSALKRYDKAITHYKEALKRAPWRGETHLNLGKTFLDTGEFRNAVVHLERACRTISPSVSVDCRMNLGTAYYKNGSPEMAIREFSNVLELDPENSGAHYNLGIAYGALGDDEKAFSEMQKSMGAGSGPNVR